ncbi:MAG: hypothetical protein ACRCYP_03950 [Alphaproteobacteria bacterium]
MSNTHAHIATQWQLKAASEGRLEAIVLPMVPEPVLVDTSDCHIPRGMEWRWITQKIHTMWGENESPCELVLKGLPYQVGDRIYLAEKWIKSMFDGIELFRLSETPPPTSHGPVVLGPGWRSPETMPVEHAQYWFEIADIQIQQVKHLNAENSYQSRLSHWGDNDEYVKSFFLDSKEMQNDYPWDSDRWVILLTIKQEK